jgi:hypothetical protein
MSIGHWAGIELVKMRELATPLASEIRDKGIKT